MISRNKNESDKGIHLSGDCCIICGWNKLDSKGNLLVIGAHVRGFRNTNDYDKYDNIIGLCPNHHVEFDRGNITINPNTKICCHINKKDEYHGGKIVGNISHIKIGHFDYHQKHIFKGIIK